LLPMNPAPPVTQTRFIAPPELWSSGSAWLQREAGLGRVAMEHAHRLE
jgi:hypothetical protein